MTAKTTTPSLTWDLIQKLIAHRGKACLTLLMTTMPEAPPQADQIQLRHLLHRAEALLIHQGFEAKDAQKFLQPVNQLTQHPEFWRNRQHGLAFFVAPDFLQWTFTEVALPELVTLSAHFYIKPLLPLAQRHGDFHVLTLSQQHVALWHYDSRAATAHLMPLAHVRNGLYSLPDHDDLEAQQQTHSFVHRSPGGATITTHSHGVGDAQQKQKIARYFHQVSQSVDDALRGSTAPLILVGVEYLQDIYRQANAYAHVLEAAISGNPDQWEVGELMALAKPLAESSHHTRVQQALAAFERVDNTAQSTRHLEDIVRLTSEGRIETVFVAQDAEQWGVLDEATQQVQRRVEPQPGDEPLLNLTVVNALRHGSQVFVLPLAQMPDAALMVAVLRY